MKYKLVAISIGIAFLCGQVVRVQFSNVGVTLLDIVIGLVALIWWTNNLKQRRSLGYVASKEMRYLLGFLAAGIVGLLLYSSQISLVQALTSGLYIVRLGAYLSFFLIVNNLPSQEKRFVMKTSWLVGFGLVAIGLLQYLYYPYLRNLYYLGWDDHLYRLFSTFLDPNFAGAFFAILVFSYIDAFFQTKKEKKHWIFVFLTVLTIIALLLTYSRTGFIMLVIGLVFYVFVFLSKRISIAVLCILIFLFLVFANTKLEGLNPLRTTSSWARIESAQQALTIIQEYPVFGVGFNAYRYAQVQMGYRDEFPEFQSHADAGTDNSYLFVLATTGIIGGIFFLVFLYQLCMRQWVISKSGSYPSRSVISGIVAILIGSFFINVLFYPMIILWMGMSMGLIRRK